MASVPGIFQFYADKISSVSSTYYSILPHTGSSKIVANGIARFALPTASILSCRDISLHFNAQCTGDDDDGGRLPNGMDKLLARVSVFIGGVCVNSFNDYATLCACKQVFEGQHLDPHGGHNDVVRTFDYMTIPDNTYEKSGDTTSVGNSETFAKDKKEIYTVNSGDRQFSMTLQNSFFSSCSPELLSMNLLPECIIEVVFAGNHALPCIADITLPASKRIGTHEAQEILSDLRCLCRVFSMGSSVLDELQASRISQVGYLTVPFHSWTTHPFGAGGLSSAAFSVSTQSLDKCYLALYRADRSTRGGFVPFANSKASGGFTARQENGTAKDDIGLPCGTDLGGLYSLQNTTERYNTRMTNLEMIPDGNNTAPTFQLMAQSALVPSTPLSIDEAYTVSKQSCDVYSKMSACSRRAYILNQACIVLSFNLPGASFRREASGLDLRGLNGAFSWLCTGLDSSKQAGTCFTQSTSFCRIGSGGQIQILL
jgi:hypothetical protein